MTGPLALYRRRVERGELAADAAQGKAAAALQRLYDDLKRDDARTRVWRRRIAQLAGRPVQPVRGLYLWGSVGRGKTLLMDLFFAALPFDAKLRRHFHRFMASVHDHLKELRDREAAKTDEREYVKPVWLCEACQYRHEAEDPPAFCPRCAGLRRYFARLDDEHAPEDPVLTHTRIRRRALGPQPVRGLVWQERRLPAAASEDGLAGLFPERTA